MLAGLGRRNVPHAAETIAAAVHAAGFATWNLDLIFGAATESDDDWAATLDHVLALDHPPPHLSAYGLTVEPGTPLAADPARHPDDDVEARRYERAEAVLTAAGYRWEEISNWARPGHECRHNHLYWEQGDYVGIGSAAHSHRAGTRWWNVRTPDRYIDAVEAGRSPEAGREELTRRAAGVRGAVALAAHAPRRALGEPRAARGPRRPRRADRRPGRADAAGPAAGQRGQRQNPLRYPAPMTETAEAPEAATDDLMEKVVRLCRTAASSSPRPRSTAGSAPPTTTARSGSTCCATSRTPGGAPWSRSATTWSASTPPSSARPPSGPPRATWPPSPTPWSTARTATSAGASDKIDGVCPNCGSERPHRGPGLQPHVQDPRRPGGGRGPRGLPAARDGPGHVHQLRQRARDDAQEAALRHRPGRQVLPQRDHAAELRLPHPRVRADGDGVLRPARRGPEVVRLLARRAHELVPRPRHPGRQAAPAPPRAERALALLARHGRRRVPLPLGLGRARGHRQPGRLRPQRPTPPPRA